MPWLRLDAGEFRGLGLQPLLGAGDVDDKARMCSHAYGVELVFYGYVERHLAPIDRRDLDGDLHGATGERGRQMLEHDFHPDRVLAGIGMCNDEVAARVFDIADEPRRRIDARVLAHEADGAVDIDQDALGYRQAGLE